MSWPMKTLLACTSLLVLLNRYTAQQTSVCYYRNWAQHYKSKARFLPEDIDPRLCSVVNYASMVVNVATHKLQGREHNDDDLLRRLNRLKEKKPSLKVFLSVGGWNHEKLPRFSQMVQRVESRRTFIRSVINYLTFHRLDGVNLDWEYPGNRGSPPQDKYRFTALLKETFEAFQEDALQRNGSRFYLTLAVSPSRKKILKAYEIKNISKYVDWVDIMAYNLRGPWRNVTGCPTDMTGNPPTVPDSLHAWLEGGMPPGKINLGLVSYGRTYKLQSPSKHNVGDPSLGSGPPGMYTKKTGILAYYEICLINWAHKTPGDKSPCATPYASTGDTWVGYDDVFSVKYKVASLVRGLGLNGISLWAMDFDDFSGNNCNQGRYPLLTAAVKEMKRSKLYII